MVAAGPKWQMGTSWNIYWNMCVCVYIYITLHDIAVGDFIMTKSWDIVRNSWGIHFGTHHVLRIPSGKRLQKAMENHRLK